MSIEMGLFLRGRLVGVKDDFEINTKTKERYDYKALGIEVPFINSFGMSSPLTKEVRIGQDKLNDAAFMKSLHDFQNDFIEVEIMVGGFKKLFVTKSAVISVLGDQELKQVG